MPQPVPDSQAPASPVLIVRGDDMGFSQSANEACIRCARDGIMTSVEIMPVTPWFPQAVRMLLENPTLDVGVHLTLTSEWDDLKWRPLTACPSLVDGRGFFRPMVVPHPDYAGKSHSENTWELAEIEAEARAQIELTLAQIPHTSHITTHMAFEELGEPVADLIAGLAKEYAIDVSLEALGVRKVTYVGAKKTTVEKIRAFVRMIESLEPARTHMFLDHPGFDTPELRACGHVGHDGVAADRQGVTDCLTSGEVREALQRCGVRLATYKEASAAARRPA